MASTYLTRTPSSAGNRKTYTLSFWIKRSSATVAQYFFHAAAGESNPQTAIEMNTNGTISFWDSASIMVTPIASLNDISSWYHIVIAVDTTQSTASNRVKFYVNGVQQTTFSTASGKTLLYPSLDYEGAINTTVKHTIGAYNNVSGYYDGLVSDFNFIDGTAYAASTFGSTNTVSGEWTPNSSPSVNYGTNGFKLTFEDTSNLGDDTSGNTNDFTLSGSGTSTLDCPSNNFATWNPLIANTGATFTKGNTVVYRTTSGNYRRIGCTLGATSGKYYAEFLLGASQWGGVCLTNGGDIARTEAGNAGYMGEYAGDYSVGIRNDGIVYSNGANVSSAQWNQGSLSTSDRLCLALDMDNKKLFLGKNGTWNVSSNPATNTGGISLTGDSYTFAAATSNADCMINAGNGYFGTTAVSSAGTNASGIGIFEYDVPTGFTALSTKGLNL